VVDVGFPNGPAIILTKELVVLVVAAHVVLDRLLPFLLHVLLSCACHMIQHHHHMP
jgi:hypothetical protein